MTKSLVIVESPSKAKTIQKYLGQGYTVLASGGHVCDLPQKTLGIDVEHGFEPEYEINPEKKETIRRLKSALKQNDVVYLATDPDREGEAISWHLKNCLEIPDGKNRIVFNEISKKAVNNAIENPRELDMNLVNSQQARRVLDRLVGYKISPILGKRIKKGQFRRTRTVRRARNGCQPRKRNKKLRPRRILDDKRLFVEGAKSEVQKGRVQMHFRRYKRQKVENS